MLGLGLTIPAIAVRGSNGPPAPPPPTWADVAAWNDNASWSDTV